MTALRQDGWSLNYAIGEGGIVLSSVKHDGFNLADDVRVTRVWVGTETPLGNSSANVVNFKLGGVSLPATTAVSVLQPHGVPPPSGTDPRDLNSPSDLFRAYHNVVGVSADFRSKDQLLKGTPNECSLDLKQRFLFGEYGRNPPHEPGAVLDAARLFPLLTFSLPAVKDRSKPHPKYVRVDYRIDVALDNIREKDVRAGGPSGVQNTRNRSGIFRDNESISVSLPRVANLFAALEKPLAYEVATYGLVEGGAPGWVRLDTWDNVHVWPAARDWVSTPGAFHALHCHWRWGAVAGGAAGPILPGAGQQSFQGLGWTPSLGGPLVDSAIARQNLSLAITRNDATNWRKEANPSERPFEKLFSDARAVPDDVSSGDDLVLWFSYEVFRGDNLDQPWSGTLFVNGMYFGHNKDPFPKVPLLGMALPPLTAVGGAYGDDQRPKATRIWVRRAR